MAEMNGIQKRSNLPPSIDRHGAAWKEKNISKQTHSRSLLFKVLNADTLSVVKQIEL
jgi:hypothetical protein